MHCNSNDTKGHEMTYKMTPKIVFLLTLLVSLLTAETLNIAVNQLSGQNIDTQTLAILSERTRTEFIQTGAFTVIERAEMDAILHEMGIQQSGICDESSCLVEVGQVLGVQQIVAGSVGKLNENFYTVSLRIIDVESSAILHAANYDHTGSLEDLLATGIKTAVTQLVNDAGVTIQDARYSGKFGELYIGSSVEGAVITVDGVQYSEVTPFLFEQFPAGHHTIVVSNGSFVGRTELTLEPDDFQRITIPMEQSLVDLFVKSSPLGATIVLDGNTVGTTPFKIEQIEAGEHAIELNLPGYASITEKITLGNEQLERFEYELLPLAYLSVTTTPSGAEVMLNGDQVGISPVTLAAIPAGSYELQISKSNYDLIHQDISFHGDDSLEVTENLISSYGTVNISTDDHAQIMVDGEAARIGHWFSQQVVPGPHTFSITLEDRINYSEQFVVTRGETFATTIELEKTPESIAASERKRQVIRRIAFGTLSAVSLGIGIKANSDLDDAVTDDEMSSAETQRNVFLAASGVFAVGFGLSIPF